MDQLPTDIVRAIAGAVDREDILSFRLTCRAFAALGLPRQFEVIPVMLFRNSLDNLRRISENPVYRNYVLTIEYGPCIVARPEARRDWIWTAKHNREGLYSSFSESEVEQAYESHVRYYSDQGHMLSSGYDVNTLQSAVSCLPNLRGVHIKWSDPANWFKTPPPAWGDAFCNMAKVMGRSDSFIWSWPRNYVREITAVFVACKFASRSLTWFDCEAFELGLLGHDGTEGVYDYIAGTVRLSTFDYFARDRPMDLGFPLVCAIFESLTSVKLEFSRDESRDYGSCQQHLGTALRGAQGLETLCIQQDSMRIRDMYPLSFTSLSTRLIRLTTTDR